MKFKEILEKLKEGANFELYVKKGVLLGDGAINDFFECEKGMMTETYYLCCHYPAKKEILESIPWNVVKNPRNPKPEEYPSEDGYYITMLDCNEHEVLVNKYTTKDFMLYNRTHVKWWIKIPENFKDYINGTN